MRVLVLGASGFIGSHVAADLASRGWIIRAGSRAMPVAGRPGFEWVLADFSRLSEVGAWTPLLDGVDAVVNCVGVLQDGAGESLRHAHEAGPRALFAACRLAGIERVIHVSAVGVEGAAGYARSKRAAEAALGDHGLVIRPSLVVARAVFGGTALIRGLAGLPWIIPVLGGDQRFRPIVMADLAALIADHLGRAAPQRGVIEACGPETLSQTDILRAYRQWLGFGPGRIVPIPRALAWPALKIGDLLGWLGWPSALRTTSLQQMDQDVAGRGEASAPGARAFSAFLAAEPASVQDRWHARLYFLRPLAVAGLGFYWLASGVVALGPGAIPAADLLDTGGLGALAGPANTLAACFDLAVGLGLLIRRFSGRAALAGAGLSVAYLAMGSILLPQLWADPLGPWMKIAPVILACLFVAATDARR